MSRRSRRWVLVVVLVIVAVGVVAAVVSILGGGVTVPDVTGMTEAEAAQALEAVGLTAGEAAQASDPEVAAGLVLRQDPAAGSDVEEGSAVMLTVSSGPGMAAVPEVVGMNRAKAEGVLAETGFVPASVLQYDLIVPAGEVVDQLPAAGQQAMEGSQVGLVVSKGRPEVSVSVPDVTGQSQSAATADLADAGLVAVAVETYSTDVPKGDVAAQEPAAGDRVTPLSEVLITISLGEGQTTVTVPDVVGMTQAAAADGLVSAGLVVTAAHAWSTHVDEDVVIAQAPKAGVKVDEGGDAGILVSLGPPPAPAASPAPSPTESREASPPASPPASPEATPPPEGPALPGEPPELTATVPDVVGMDATEAEQELVGLGLRPIRLSAPSATVQEGKVSAQLPASGKQVPKTYPVLLLVSTGLVPQVDPL